MNSWLGRAKSNPITNLRNPRAAKIIHFQIPRYRSGNEGISIRSGSVRLFRDRLVLTTCVRAKSSCRHFRLSRNIDNESARLMMPPNGSNETIQSKRYLIRKTRGSGTSSPVPSLTILVPMINFPTVCPRFASKYPLTTKKF